jgi:hypothetical protein
MKEEERRELEENSQLEMEQLALRLKGLILSQPPKELLGYVWGSMAVASMFADEPEDRAKHRLEMSATQFVLEYIHAVLSSFPATEPSVFEEAAATEISTIAEELRGATSRYCLSRSLGMVDGVFGKKTGEIYQAVQSNWVAVRGNRYGRLEQEFLSFVLEPHDSVLRELYGIGVDEIAAGIQAIVDSMAGGHANAADRMEELMDHAGEQQDGDLTPTDQVAGPRQKEHPERLTAVADIYADLFHGGILNVSKHTALPMALLEDLAYERGGNTDFFAPGPLSGTPLRTLPARVRPLIKIDGEYFAADHAFVRDATYRALLWHVLQRKQDYVAAFHAKQKDMSELAFSRILGNHLPGAIVLREIWYRDPTSRQWVENDTLIRIDDVLLVVEAKTGAGATIASPAADFERHTRAINDLIVKAYAQCKRFLAYIHSSEEVPLYAREDERYVEIDRVRSSDFRLIFPIGLTVESFSPYSSFCKELSGIDPILGQYPFLSLSIDDLFVLRRILPTAGEFFHYLETRQSVAGIKGALLYDEMDHLGAYLAHNRYDLVIKSQLTGRTDVVWWDGMSNEIDAYFAEADIDTVPPPRQEYPVEVQKLLDALDAAEEPGWLAVESHIRTIGDEGRTKLAAMLQQVGSSLAQRTSRYFQLGNAPPLFVWLQRVGSIPDLKVIRTKAAAGAISAGSSNTTAVLAYLTPAGDYSRGVALKIDVPRSGTPEHAALVSEVERMERRKGK